MAESSVFWTTGSTGDGTTPYTQSQLFAWLTRTFLDDNTKEGVIGTHLNCLKVTGTASPIQVDTGAALVAGIPYENTSAVSVAITTPVVGTTGFRIVLRADYTAQTVRITKIMNTDGLSAIPAATQNANVTWDITLATGTITTGGVIALTDARYQVYHSVPLTRMGGSASDWSSGANTAQILTGGYLIQIGITPAYVVPGPTVNVTFPRAFSSTPWLTGVASLSALSNTGFSYSQAGGVNGTVSNWIAIGPA